MHNRQQQPSGFSCVLAATLAEVPASPVAPVGPGAIASASSVAAIGRDPAREDDPIEETRRAGYCGARTAGWPSPPTAHRRSPWPRASAAT